MLTIEKYGLVGRLDNETMCGWSVTDSASGEVLASGLIDDNALRLVLFACGEKAPKVWLNAKLIEANAMRSVKG